MDKPLQKISGCFTTSLKTSTYILTFVDSIETSPRASFHPTFSIHILSKVELARNGLEFTLHTIYIGFTSYLHIKAFLLHGASSSVSTISQLQLLQRQLGLSFKALTLHVNSQHIFLLTYYSSCKFIQLCPVETCVHKTQIQRDTKIEYIKTNFNSQLIFGKLTLIECQASIWYSNNWSKTQYYAEVYHKENHQVKSLNDKSFIQEYIVVV